MRLQARHHRLHPVPLILLVAASGACTHIATEPANEQVMTTAPRVDAGTRSKPAHAARDQDVKHPDGDADSNADDDEAAAEDPVDDGSSTDAGRAEASAGDELVALDQPDGGTDAALRAYLKRLNKHPNVSCDQQRVCTLSTSYGYPMLDDLELYAFAGVSYELEREQIFYVGDDVEETVFTLHPGVWIAGTTDTGIAVRRGSKIMAQGTAQAPIVFTSAKAVEGNAKDPPSAGDWFGLFLNGRATNNQGEDVADSYGNVFGGTQDDDSSGILSYVRVEYAGFGFGDRESPDGIALQSVGSGTVIDHVQVHHAADDGIELHGGTVSMRHVVLTGVGDDSLDWSEGWTGTAQYVLIDQKRPGVKGFMPSSGIEANNVDDDRDLGMEPISSPSLANFTIVKDGPVAHLLHLRGGTHADLWNVLVLGWGDGEGSCIRIETQPTFKALQIHNMLQAGCGDPSDPDTLAVTQGVNDPPGAALSVWEATGSNTWLEQVADARLDDAFVPRSGSPVLNAKEVDSTRLQRTNYIGAFAEAEDWAKGWTRSNVTE